MYLARLRRIRTPGIHGRGVNRSFLVVTVAAFDREVVQTADVQHQVVRDGWAERE